jgi:CHASE3 domain sensor protein
MFMTWRRATAVGFGVALLVVAASGWILSRNIATVIEAARAVAQSHEAQAELTALLSEIAGAAMASHAFLIAGGEPHLEPFSLALEAIDARLERLRQLTAKNPNQLQRISLLRGLIDEKIAQLHHLIDVHRGEGFQPEAQLALTNHGKTLLARIRWVIETMKGEEQGLLARRNELLQSRTRLSYATITVGMGLCVMLLALMGYLFMREITARARVEDELRQTKEGSMAP